VVFSGRFSDVLLGLFALSAGGVAIAYVYTHLKFDFHVSGFDWRQKITTIHFTEIWQRFYDTTLNEHVAYAKHAISIDENRKDFERVKWGSTREDSRDHNGNPRFEQVWLCGNHSDIGGSYLENEARLSDITLDWMVKSATSIPDGVAHDAEVLKVSPYPNGVQHDEVKMGFGLLTKLFGITWAEEHRVLPENKAIMHRSVYARFDLPAVQIYDRLSPYRPETLRTHIDFARYYEPGSIFPATSALDATTAAEEPD
jgi:Uncharacterized alpha/beta hydrolase domain (DUF2235)